jgi:transcriptional regulator with XRE-family HTH domain|nr:helix-turn-helix transcriptional regulator [uncultured Oscillibacter sp.]DAZ27202.1 MAG TPA: Helix-turn-helix XRE-family like protein [Caudoviricetes sp.]
MPGNGSEIYRTCREQAGLTQEQAAEGLNCSVRQLARYEAGEAPVPDDIAYQMVVLYDSQLLAVQHLRLVSHVAAEILPPVTVLDLPRAAIRIINLVGKFAERHRERALLDIAEDGVISPEERPLFDEIMEELQELVRAIMELGLSEDLPAEQRPKPKARHVVGIKKERPEGGASRRSVQGLAPENNSEIILSHFARKCKSRTVREGVNLR